MDPNTEVAVRVYEGIKENARRYYYANKEEVLRKKREKYAESRKDVPPKKRGRPPKNKEVKTDCDADRSLNPS